MERNTFHILLNRHRVNDTKKANVLFEALARRERRLRRRNASVQMSNVKKIFVPKRMSLIRLFFTAIIRPMSNRRGTVRLNSRGECTYIRSPRKCESPRGKRRVIVVRCAFARMTI